MPNFSTQEYPAISGDRIVWSDSRNYPPVGSYRDIFLYSIPDGNVTVVNKAPLIPSPPYIHGDYVLWSDRGTGPSSRVHLYTISTGEDRVLDDSSSGYVTGFSMSGDYIVWTLEEFRGNDIPDAIHVVYDLRKGAAVSVCPEGVAPFSVSGNTFLVSDAGGIGFCGQTRKGYPDPNMSVQP
jgi:beta propeller repeat protein